MNTEHEMRLLKNDRSVDPLILDVPDADKLRAFKGIRCPACKWRPAPGSLWSCNSRGTPEPAFASCGTLWNTFTTEGRCPGCDHQWQWTSCLRCTQWSLHRDWYVDDDVDS
jgi:hypothetical protein